VPPKTARFIKPRSQPSAAVIAPGEQVMLIVPDADTLNIEAKIARRTSISYA